VKLGQHAIDFVVERRAFLAAEGVRSGGPDALHEELKAPRLLSLFCPVKFVTLGERMVEDFAGLPV